MSSFVLHQQDHLNHNELQALLHSLSLPSASQLAACTTLSSFIFISDSFTTDMVSIWMHLNPDSFMLPFVFLPWFPQFKFWIHLWRQATKTKWVIYRKKRSKKKQKKQPLPSFICCCSKSLCCLGDAESSLPGHVLRSPFTALWGSAKSDGRRGWSLLRALLLCRMAASTCERAIGVGVLPWSRHRT